MTLVLTPEAAQEARRLIARLGELLQAAEAVPALPEPPPAGGGPRVLTAADFEAAAARLGCGPAEIRAVYEVESAGAPFGPDGRATVLYEGHKFSEFTARRYDRTHGGVSWPTWDKTRYPRGTAAERHAANWAKIEYAAGLDRDAAYRSASYGAPQIMGFNFKACGFADVHAFVGAMNRSAADQLAAFTDLVLAWGLDDELRDRRWAAFARRYNGPRYAENGYDRKLAAAFATWTARLTA
ncbi:N-acetylmuramidase family protein [Phenylobacterium sp.]|uniref:N-acetylmuramidase family protein n=1 Tax=Phenylobacterium sp. TaxID=1871053 RepID=UPI00301E52A3